jgi:hypothetical protein
VPLRFDEHVDLQFRRGAWRWNNVQAEREGSLKRPERVRPDRATRAALTNI